MSVFNRLLNENPLRLRDVAQQLHDYAVWCVDEDECRYDHDDYCQTHLCSKPCKEAAMRKLLAELDEIEGYE